MVKLEESDYKNVLFGLVCKFLRRKNLLEKFVKCSYEFHSIKHKEYTLPECTNKKEKIRRVIEHNVTNYISSSNFNNAYCETFSSRIRNFFVSYEGCFDWEDTGDGRIWDAMNDEWHIFSKSEVKKLICYGFEL